MMVVDAHFERLSEVSITSLLGSVGTYVIWTPDAVARPSYIGEGDILARILDHAGDRFGRNLDGYVAALGYSTERQAKFDSELVEGTLLDAADLLGRFPAHNQQGPRVRALWSRLARGHRTIRVNISGWHPLRWNSRLENTSQFNWRYDEREQCWQLDDRLPWRR